MLPLAAMSLISAVPSAAQGITALLQGRKANQLSEGLVDPNYQIPGEYGQVLGNARSLASQKYMSGYGDLQEQVAQNTAGATSDILNAATSSSDALGAITQLQRNNNNTQSQIGFQNSQSLEGRQGDLRQALAMMGGQREKQFQLNVQDRFNRDAAAASALKFGALNNGYNAVKGLSNAGAMYFGNKMLGLGGQAQSPAPTAAVPQAPPATIFNPGAPITYQGGQLTPEQLQMLQYQMQNPNPNYNPNFQ